MPEEEVATETNGQDSKDTENKDEATELENAIIRQVEYYFGDMNIVRDKFIREMIKLDDGWIPMQVLLRFNRLAKLSKDPEVIVKALNKSTTGLIEISEDNQKIRRSPEMPIPEMNEERRKELQARTVYVKGFPKDSVVDDLLNFFKKVADTDNLIMRRYLDRKTKARLFKGSVFVTFKTKEEAQKFLDNKEIKYEENELITLWQEEYLQKKQIEYAEKKEKKEKKNKAKDEAKAVKEEKDELKLPTGTVFHFSEAANTTKREHIKEALSALGAEIAYIDFQFGDTQGWVRLTKENAAKEFAEKLTDGKIKIGETDVVFKVLKGEEETAYLKKTVEEMVKRRKNQKNFNKNKGKNFRGKQGKKRRQDQHEDAPPSKVKADS